MDKKDLSILVIIFISYFGGMIIGYDVANMFDPFGQCVIEEAE